MKKSLLSALSFLLLTMSLSAQDDKKADVFVNSNGKLASETLVIINGEAYNIELNWIDPRVIKSITVLKDQPAIDSYGEAGRKGVILLTTKDYIEPVTSDCKSGELIPEQSNSKGQQISGALVLINGEACNIGLSWIDPRVIKSISVLKNQPAIDIYGEAGRNGVILVTINDTIKPD